jgi:phosphopantothenoylcysteine decarboxylase/phosphopantothenate--cysteine ligase
MRVLVTAGPTREHFDSVRFISNPSSGKMGYAVAAAALTRGHQVELVSGPVDIDPPEGAQVIAVTSAEEMFRACCDRFEHCDAAILAAAVCDYRPARVARQKVKKQAVPRRVTLKPAPDIAAHLGAVKGRRVVVGFAMEDHDHRANAEAKLARKRFDAIVLNDLDTVGADHARVEFLVADGAWSSPIQGNKAQLATEIVRLTEKLMEDRR